LPAAQIHTHKAIIAPYAVKTEPAIGGIAAILAEVTIISVLHIHTFITPNGIFRKSAISTILAKSDPIAIITVFILIMPHHKITVL